MSDAFSAYPTYGFFVFTPRLHARGRREKRTPTLTPIHRYTDGQILRYTDTQIQMHKYTDAQIHRYADTQKHRNTDTQIHRYTDT